MYFVCALSLLFEGNALESCSCAMIFQSVFSNIKCASTDVSHAYSLLSSFTHFVLHANILCPTWIFCFEVCLVVFFRLAQVDSWYMQESQISQLCLYEIAKPHCKMSLLLFDSIKFRTLSGSVLCGFVWCSMEVREHAV